MPKIYYETFRLSPYDFNDWENGIRLFLELLFVFVVAYQVYYEFFQMRTAHKRGKQEELEPLEDKQCMTSQHISSHECYEGQCYIEMSSY